MSEADPEKLRQFAYQVFSKLEGALTSGMIHLGDKLGLYRTLAAADGPMSSGQLAASAGLDERWVREWLFNQAAAELIATDGGRMFTMTPEAVAVLADPRSAAFGAGSFHDLPQAMADLVPLVDSFRTGVGHDYDSHGRECASAWNAASSRGTGSTCSRPCCRHSTASSKSSSAAPWWPTSVVAPAGRCC